MLVETFQNSNFFEIKILLYLQNVNSSNNLLGLYFVKFSYKTESSTLCFIFLFYFDF